MSKTIDMSKMSNAVSNYTGPSTSSTMKSKAAKYTAIEIFARDHGFYGEIKVKEDGGTYALFEKEIRPDKEKYGTITIEHEYYPEHKGSDEWVRVNMENDWTLFAREALEISLMLKAAHDIATKLDKLHKIK